MSFVTDQGLEVPSVTAGQMRELDRVATEQTGPTLLQMMENAGRSLAELALERLGPGWRTASVLVLAGAGGNGGGGLCAARHLANRGLRVRACLTDPRRLREATVLQRRLLAAAGAEEVPEGMLGAPDLVLDALLGYSLAGPPRGAAARLIDWANRASAPILSLDLPSGVDATTGTAPGAHVRAAATLTLALPKVGLSTGLALRAAGDLVLADLGIPAEAFRRAGLGHDSPYDARYRVPLHHFPAS